MDNEIAAEDRAKKETQTQGLKSKKVRTIAFITASLVFVLIAGVYTAYSMLVLSKRAQTDDAYVQGQMVNISSEVAGRASLVNASETQFVQKGEVLIKLNSNDAKAALAKARANLENVVRQVKQQYLQVKQLDALTQVHLQDLKKAQSDLNRRVPLAHDQTVSQEVLDTATQQVRSAKAAYDVAAIQLQMAQSAVKGIDIAHHPAIEAAKAAYVGAALALEHDIIRAPTSGLVAKRAIQQGNVVVPGATLMTIIPLSTLWVDANFKESELKNIRIGQPVTLNADMYGDEVVFHGKVTGLSPGTGSALALLPVQNASGNWIKIVQRVPVRITLDEQELKQHPLRVGLTMTATIDTSEHSGALVLATLAKEVQVSHDQQENLLVDAKKEADQLVAQTLAKIAG